MARTKITNVSGVKKHFGFIPPHGAELDVGEEVVLDGDLRTVLASGRGRFSRKTEIGGLDYAIANGEVVEEPVAEPSSSSSSA